MERASRFGGRLGRPRTLAVSGATVGGLMLAVYLWVVVGEGNNALPLVAGWAFVMGLACTLALASVASPVRSSRWMLIASTGVFAALGVVTSLGPGFMLAAVLTGIAAYRTAGAHTPAPRP